MVRAHDLRGAFVTYVLAHGRTETWAADRTGYRPSTMTNRYRRVARSVVVAQPGDLAPLDGAIPEIAAAETAADAAAETKKVDKTSAVSYENEDTIGLIAQSVELRTSNAGFAAGTDRDLHDSPGDAEARGGKAREQVAAPVAVAAEATGAAPLGVPLSEDDLVSAITRATLNGSHATAELLATELRARRERAAGNVRRIDEAKSRRPR